MAARDVISIAQPNPTLTQEWATRRTAFNVLITGNSGSGTGTPPTVTVVSPAANTQIAPTTPIVVNVEDLPAGLFRRVLLVLRLDALGVEEVVHNGDQFSAQYDTTPNLREVITNGYRYTLLRRGGWPASPTLVPYVIDAEGTENG